MIRDELAALALGFALGRNPYGPRPWNKKHWDERWVQASRYILKIVGEAVEPDELRVAAVRWGARAAGTEASGGATVHWIRDRHVVCPMPLQPETWPDDHTADEDGARATCPVCSEQFRSLQAVAAMFPNGRVVHRRLLNPMAHTFCGLQHPLPLDHHTTPDWDEVNCQACRVARGKFLPS